MSGQKRPLRHANEPYTKDLKEVVVYQGFREEREGIPHVEITMMSIDKLNKDTFDPKYFEMKGLPLYRIRYVVEKGKAYTYTGYDQFAIQRDEGDITDQTYNEIKEALDGRR